MGVTRNWSVSLLPIPATQPTVTFTSRAVKAGFRACVDASTNRPNAPRNKARAGRRKRAPVRLAPGASGIRRGESRPARASLVPPRRPDPVAEEPLLPLPSTFQAWSCTTDNLPNQPSNAHSSKLSVCFGGQVILFSCFAQICGYVVEENTPCTLYNTKNI